MAWDFDGTGEILLVDKPASWTSFDVVRKVRNLFHIRKIGHGGTLDPRATGLLILCTGPRTKDLDAILGTEKEYTGSFRLGIETASFDLETEVTKELPWEGVTEAALDEAFRAFLGRQTQLPPMYSAVKHHGRALYKYARKGKEVERPTREIEIFSFERTATQLPEVSFRVVCSKGTYIRSLVHDVGTRLGCGATLTELRRTRIGHWKVEDAWTVERLTKLRADRSPLSPGMHGIPSTS